MSEIEINSKEISDYKWIIASYEKDGVIYAVTTGTNEDDETVYYSTHSEDVESPADGREYTVLFVSKDPLIARKVVLMDAYGLPTPSNVE